MATISTKSAAWLAQNFDREKYILALTLWRENRGGLRVGMQSVANVLENRVRRNNTSFYTECVKPWQFTSITDPADPEYDLLPGDTEYAWGLALSVADQCVNGQLPDITGGSTVYYNPNAITSTVTISIPTVGVVKFPHTWNADVLTFKGLISKQLFFVER